MTHTYKLSDVFDLQMGKTPSRDIKEYWQDGEYEWISIADLTKSGKYICETKEKISQLAVEESGIRRIPSNTVIMSFKLSIGKVAITKKSIFSNEAIMAFIDKGVVSILPQYAYYLFSAQTWDNARKDAILVEGAQANIAQKTLLEEQLKAVKEQNEQLKENYRLLNELYENSKVDAQKSAKNALHNKIFGWVSFGVGTFIGIAGILFGLFFS